MRVRINGGVYVWLLAALYATAPFAVLAPVVHAQRVLLFENFEGVPPDPADPELCALDVADFDPLKENGELPDDFALVDACVSPRPPHPPRDFVEDRSDRIVDRYNRSRVIQGDEALATITGATYPDPFDQAGNQSLVMANPNQATQMAVNYFNQFPGDTADPNYYLRNGVIQFDVHLETPQPESVFTFLGIRFGFEPDPADRNQVATTGDQVIWNVFNLFGDVIDDPAKDQIAQDVLLQRREPQYRDNLYDQVNNLFFVDPAEISGNEDDGIIVAERDIRVRYDIVRTASEGTYRVSLDNLEDDDPPVELQWPGGPDRPWAEIFDFNTFTFVPAPGINEISFMSDASALAITDVSQSVYIDNLVIIDNDFADTDGDYDGSDIVDGRDFLFQQRSLPMESGAIKVDGDSDGDGDVDAADVAIYQMTYGTTTPPPPPIPPEPAAAVPEPTSTGLAIGGLFACLALTRRMTLAVVGAASIA